MMCCVDEASEILLDSESGELYRASLSTEINPLVIDHSSDLSR